eukprot:13324242-Alexandrium_andersonii.AAC.1
MSQALPVAAQLQHRCPKVAETSPWASLPEHVCTFVHERGPIRKATTWADDNVAMLPMKVPSRT